MTAKDKVKDMDMKEDVNALTEGEDLSEEFNVSRERIRQIEVRAFEKLSLAVKIKSAELNLLPYSSQEN